MIVHTSPVEDRLLATVCEIDRDVVFEIVERLDKMITERESVIVDLNEQLRELALQHVERLRKEVERAWDEGFTDPHDEIANEAWTDSRAKQVAEGNA